MVLVGVVNQTINDDDSFEFVSDSYVLRKIPQIILKTKYYFYFIILNQIQLTSKMIRNVQQFYILNQDKNYLLATLIYMSIKLLIYFIPISRIQFHMNLNQIDRFSKQNKVNRSININRIKHTLKHIPIISKNRLMIQKRISLNTDMCSEMVSNDSISIDNQEETCIPTLQHIQLFQQKYELYEKIGEGSNGVVHRCVKKKTGKIYAVKSFMFDDEQIHELKKNFFMVKQLNHKNIIKYQALFLDIKKHAGWLIMELISAPSLSKIVFSDQNQYRYVFQQLLETLNYLHKKVIAHRDLKLQNILYDQKIKQIKIIDFGICRNHKRRGIKYDMLTITGTLYYRSPQMFNGGGYNQKVDIWAAGILLYKLIEGHTPFQSQYHCQTIQNILHKQIQFSQKFDKFSPALKNLIQRLLNRNPSNRLSASESLRDVWFYPMPVQNYTNHHKGSYNEMIEDQLQQLSPLPFFEPIKSYVRQINGAQYHCIDSDGEVFEGKVKKRRNSLRNHILSVTK